MTGRYPSKKDRVTTTDAHDGRKARPSSECVVLARARVRGRQSETRRTFGRARACVETETEEAHGRTRDDTPTLRRSSIVRPFRGLIARREVEAVHRARRLSAD